MAGTWASASYFDRDASTIREEFAFVEDPDVANAKMLEAMGSCQSLCVHVRRGDYVQIAETNRRYGVCSLDYYSRAFEHVAKIAGSVTAFVFSDDPEWTEVNLKLPCETIYVSHNVGRRNYEDLRLMSACQHFIIANSTFSWWGAWLAKYNEKIIVAPRQWSLDPQTIADPVPGDWVRC